MFIIGLLLGAGVMIFVLQNITVVTISFLVWHFDASLALIILISVVAGVLIGALLSLPELIRKDSARARLERHNKELARELDAHKEKLAEAQTQLAHAEPVVVEKTTIVQTDQSSM